VSLHLHRWVIAAAEEWRRTTIAKTLVDAKNGQPVTLALHRCTRCSKARTVEIPGHWTLQDLTGKPQS
jgi:D-tyrosyl-tRNA(Tyr) deacylase